ncbi:hypothetical protein D3C75_812730 [compost metagenome]
MRNVIGAAVVTGDHIFNPRFIRHHLFSNSMDCHSLMADRAIRTHQIAHRVHYLAVDDIDGCYFYHAALQATGFRINNAQHTDALRPAERYFPSDQA